MQLYVYVEDTCVPVYERVFVRLELWEWDEGKFSAYQEAVASRSWATYGVYVYYYEGSVTRGACVISLIIVVITYVSLDHCHSLSVVVSVFGVYA